MADFVGSEGNTNGDDDGVEEQTESEELEITKTTESDADGEENSDSAASLSLVINEVTKTKYGMAPLYCPICSLPSEYCEYGPSYDLCLPWILQNCPEVLGQAALEKSLGKMTMEAGEEKEEVEDKKKKKRGGASVPKKVAVVETKVLITRIQRQKRKFVTSVVGLDTVPDLKLKDAAKAFGKKFSSGASIGDTATGAKEIVIQGDVIFELPTLLINEFKVNKSSIFIVEDGTARPYDG